MNAAEVLIRRLEACGVERIFTLCGNGLDPLLAAADRRGMDLIDVHNEQAAAYMADTHGRLTGQVGVCAVSSGVAHANAMTGVLNAWFDGAPMLLLTGASDRATYGLGHFQQLDHVALAAPVCKLARQVDDPTRIAQAVDKAMSVARAGRPGPVQLTLPVDVLDAEVDEAALPPLDGPLPPASIGPGDPDQVTRAAELLDQAERPLLVAGSGIHYAGGQDALMRFASSAGVPIVVPIWDRGCVPRPCRQFVGFVGPASGEPRLLADADLVLLVGARVDYRVGSLGPPKVRSDMRLVRVSADAEELAQGRRADVAILGDPSLVLDQLTEQVKAPKETWLAEAERRAKEFRDAWENMPTSSGADLNGRGLVEILRPFITDETIFLADGGDIGQWAHMVLGHHYPAHWLTCGASGVVGWGLPGAIAAKLAHPERPVLLLSGDGAAAFTIAELETAARHKVPIVMVIADDEAWGIVVAGQTRTYGRTIASELGPTRYDLVAEGFGVRGVRTADPEQLRGALAEALASDGPTLIQVPIKCDSPTDRARGLGA